MHKPEFYQENEKHKILRNFEMQMSHPIPAKRPDLLLIMKKSTTLPFQQTTEWKKTWQIAGPYQRIENIVEHESDGDTKYSWNPWKLSPRTWKR